MEKKYFKFEIKKFEDNGEFEGYASVFGIVDYGGDIVESGAFTKTLKEKKEFPLLWYHDPRQPVGMVTAEKEDEKGLKIKGTLDLNIEKAKELYSLIKKFGKKVIQGLSIGYDVIKQSWEGDTRHLKELKLWEVSLATFPMNPEAVITSVKAVVPFQDLPLASMDRAWDKLKALARVRRWAGGPSKEDMNWSKYRKAFLWYDADDPESFGAYKLPIADVIDGQLKAVPRAIFAAAAAIRGARGGVNIPESDVPKIKSHLAKYYRKMDRTPPWETDSIPLDELIYTFIDSDELREIKAGRTISQANAKLIRQAIEILNALLEASEPSDDDTQKDKKKSQQDSKSIDHLLSEISEELKILNSKMEVKNGREN
jgi:HK97 family phage prohead protease